MPSTIDDTSSGKNRFVSDLYVTSIAGRSCDSRTILNGHSFMSACTVGSSYLRPISRFASNTVFSALRAAWFLAAVPTRRSVSEKDTYDGVVRSPMSLGIISTVLFFHVPTHEYVVPRSMPHDGIFFALSAIVCYCYCCS